MSTKTKALIILFILTHLSAFVGGAYLTVWVMGIIYKLSIVLVVLVAVAVAGFAIWLLLKKKPEEEEKVLKEQAK